MQSSEERQASVSFVGGASYKGGLSSSGFSGHGTYTDEHGFEYSGNFVDGILHGDVSVFLRPVRATAKLTFDRGRL